MRSAIYDEWLQKEIENNSGASVLHIGCGLDSRIERVSKKNTKWYDIDFPDVIEERRKYFTETDSYFMLAIDMRSDEWKKRIDADQDAIIVLEGVSMYFSPEELNALLSNLAKHFHSIKLLMDCYTERAAKMSKYKNPVNDVGVTNVYGYDNPNELAEKSELVFVKEYDMTPQKYIDELQGIEKIFFKKLFAGKIAKSMYRMYEFEKEV